MATLTPQDKLYQPIYADIDIDDQLEAVKDLARAFDNFTNRLMAQGAPTQLSGLMQRLRDIQVEAHNTLSSIRPCFPNEPKKPPP